MNATLRLSILGPLTLSLVWPAASAAQIDEIYRRTPIAAHRWLKQQVLQGHEIAEDVERIRRLYNEESFSSLKLPRAHLLPWLRLEIQAVEHWESGDLVAARATYQEAVKGLLEIGAKSEAILCLYYIAEIESELEQFSNSLETSSQAIDYLEPDSQPFLAGLLFESRGYAYWYLDNLAGSIRSFGLATRAWQSIQFQEGLVQSWNNLAVLYEELRIPEQAEECYRAAISNLPAEPLHLDADQIYANYAVFLYRSGRKTKARQQLAFLQPGAAGKEGLQLAIAEVLENAELLPPPKGLRPTERIERLLLLGSFAQREEKIVEAKAFFSKVLSEARREDNRLLERTAATRLGRILEELGRFDEALLLYRDLIAQAPTARPSDQFFPYFRAVSPLFDGVIRSQIHLGQPDQARQEIQQLTASRQRNTAHFLSQVSRVDPGSNHLHPLIGVATLSMKEAKHERRETQTFAQPADCTIIELWPDGNSLYLWVQNSEGTTFHQVKAPVPIRALVDRVTTRLFESDQALPRRPSELSIRRLSTLLVHPVEERLQTRRLLIVPHKELEALPFELLELSTGVRLLSRFVISYLPAAPPTNPPVDLGLPLILTPASDPDTELPPEVHLLKQEFPKQARIMDIAGPFPRAATWIHVSSHLRLDDRFWLTSAFDGGGRQITIADFVRRMPRTQLLSLAVCDSGNSRYPVSPFWLGYAGLFLAGGTDALVLNRWPLDELSSKIYLDFIRAVLQGLPMDEALREAKLRFQQQTLTRQGVSVQGDHPFFWAGITYVGWPGKQLNRDGQILPQSTLTRNTWGLLILACGVWLLLRSIRHSTSHNQHMTVTALDRPHNRQRLGQEVDLGLLEDLEQDR
ncbi:MAG: CHAT domain-containing protein [Acidobacteriota bacterium]|nr:MAG: CHAT domain-containing protein [Acidobacteriota bacterium]